MTLFFVVTWSKCHTWSQWLHIVKVVTHGHSKQSHMVTVITHGHRSHIGHTQTQLVTAFDSLCSSFYDWQKEEEDKKEEKKDDLLNCVASPQVKNPGISLDENPDDTPS